MRIVSPAWEGMEAARQPSREKNETIPAETIPAEKTPTMVDLLRRIFPPFLGSMPGTGNDGAWSQRRKIEPAGTSGILI
jgi:hypothetical protein